MSEPVINANEKYMALLLANSPNVLLIFDEHHRLVCCSDFFLHLIGLDSSDSIIGKTAREIFPVNEHSGRLLALAAQSRAEGGTFDIEKKLHFQGDKERDYQIKIVPMLDEEHKARGVLVVMTDISTLAAAKAEAEAAREEAIAASNAKSDFLARMSHDIRTPMNAIIGMSELMRTDNLDQVQAGYFRDIRAMSHQLLSLINDILDFSKISAGKMDLVPSHFNLHGVFDHITSMHRFMATSRSLEFRSHWDGGLPDVVFADELRIRQIMSNLASNAVKYTKTGFVEITMTQDNSGTGPQQMVFSVRDSGIGILPENIPNLFSEFSQFDQQKNKGIQGSGLGLPIVKQLLELMGGRIEVESVYGQGSTFRAFIPYKPGDPSQVTQAAGGDPFVVASSAPRPPALLVVDDLDVNLSVARGFLLTHKMKADTALSGQEALELIKAKPYDVIFMDHMMPGMDGVECTETIRSLTAADAAFTLPRDSYFEDVPVVALTANAIAGMRSFFLKHGFSGFISKPIDASQLNSALREFLPQEKIELLDKPPEQEHEKSPPIMEDKLLRALQAINGLDIKEGLRLNANDKGMYLKTLRQVEKSVPREYTQLKKEYDAADWENFGIRSHGLKSVFATIGAYNLRDEGKKFEFAAKEGRFDECKKDGPAFFDNIKQFINALSNALGQNDIGPGETAKTNIPVTARPLPEIIESLALACGKARSRDIERLLKELQAAVRGSDSPLDKITAMIENYDMEEAAAALRAWKEKL